MKSAPRPTCWTTTLSIDGSLYYIDWKDIQLSLVNAQTGLGYTGNGSEAKSQGFELSVESKPVTGTDRRGVGDLQRCGTHGGVPDDQ